MGSLLQAILQKKASCLDCRLIATLGEASPAARRISILSCAGNKEMQGILTKMKVVLLNDDGGLRPVRSW